MAENSEYKISWCGRDLVLSTGKLAPLASGSMMVRYGQTVVLATVCIGQEPREGVDFFPLMVDYEERLYASGKISGSRFIKREGRPSDQAVLNCRLVDRPLRPLFPKEYRNDIQIVITVLSYDKENEPDILAIVGAAAALRQSSAPYAHSVGAVRVGLIDGKFVANPTREELEKSELNLVVAATKEKVMMIEGDANQLPEEKILEAIKFAHQNILPTLELQEQIPLGEKLETGEEAVPKIYQDIEKYLGKRVKEAIVEIDKEKREKVLAEFKEEIMKNFEGDYKQIELKLTFEKLVEKEIRKAILEEERRPDGRKISEIRPIEVEVALMPRIHGSALFTRGQTQTLSIVTLGAPGEEQVVETMEEEGTKRFMHHYNFPPFSTGEVSPMRSTSRREIGHGALVERAFKYILPSKEDFPYTIRVVSEVLASNGSSSMASTCSATMALMDAGVPLRTAVAGIAIGLVAESDKKYKILTDIQGLEDFAGDMDFKVSGSKKGICAIQVDTKINGLSIVIVSDALDAAKNAREEILKKMEAVLKGPRGELSTFAPRIETLTINKEKIGEVIGPGGKTIRKIIEEAGGAELVSIDIEEDGTVLISSLDKGAAAKAIEQIKNLTAEAEVGKIYEGKVVKIMDFGAFVQILPGKDGLVHISQLSSHRVASVRDVVKEGDEVKVKVVGIDDQGRVNLSMKGLEK